MKLENLKSLLTFLPWRNPAPVVAVLRLDGVIGHPGRFSKGISLSTYADLIERAFSMKRVKAVALAINSPGGSPVQSALVAKRIRDMADEKEIPVLAFAEDVAASGGYWLACAADKIYANESSIIGSIGVISASFGFKDAIEKLGIERRLHTSGEKKSLLDPFLAENPADLKRLESLQREIHDSFIAYVKERRKGKISARAKSLFTGEFWTGAKALDLGLVDGLGDVRGVLRERFGEKVKLRLVAPQVGLLKRLSPRFGGASVIPDLSGFGQAFRGGWADDLLSTLETRAHWDRFGL